MGLTEGIHSRVGYRELLEGIGIHSRVGCGGGIGNVEVIVVGNVCGW